MRTFFHCGTTNAGDGSKHLADAIAQLAARTIVDRFIMI